jgi:hypothetical protein
MCLNVESFPVNFIFKKQDCAEEVAFLSTVRGLAMVVLLARKFDRCTNFQFCRNVQSKPFPATVAKPLLGAYPFCSSVSRALDWWLFCIFCLALCGWKNANVPPKALAVLCH